jgi:hypothetical protein
MDQTDFLELVMKRAVVPTHVFMESIIDKKKQLRITLWNPDVTHELSRAEQRLAPVSWNGLNNRTRNTRLSDMSYYHMTDIRSTDPFFMMLMSDWRGDKNHILSTSVRRKFGDHPIRLMRWCIRTYILSDNFRRDFETGLGTSTVDNIKHDLTLNFGLRALFVPGMEVSPYTLVTDVSDGQNYHLIRKQLLKITNEGLSTMVYSFIQHLLQDRSAEEYFANTFFPGSCSDNIQLCLGVTIGGHLMDLYTILRMLRTHDIDKSAQTKFIYITSGAAHITDMHQYFATFIVDKYNGQFLTPRAEHTVSLHVDTKCIENLPNIDIPLTGF